MPETLDAFGGLDIIVNNAGYSWDAVIQNMTDKQWYAMMEIHTVTPFRILREASHYIREVAKKEQAANGRATPRKVVNVSSVAGVHGNPGQASYSTGKAGITGLTKTLAREWGRYNVQVNCVCFGFIETRMTAPKEQAEKLQRDGEEVALGIPEKMRQMAAQTIPLGRPGTPEEAAGAMLLLASPFANYITGQVLEVTLRLGWKPSGFSLVQFLPTSYTNLIAQIDGPCHTANYWGANHFPQILLHFGCFV